MPLFTCPRRYATPLRVAGNHDGAPPVGIVRPDYSVPSATAMGKSGFVNACLVTTVYEKAFPKAPSSSQLLAQAAFKDAIARGRAR